MMSFILKTAKLLLIAGFLLSNVPDEVVAADRNHCRVQNRLGGEDARFTECWKECHRLYDKYYSNYIVERPADRGDYTYIYQNEDLYFQYQKKLRECIALQKSTRDTAGVEGPAEVESVEVASVEVASTEESATEPEATPEAPPKRFTTGQSMLDNVAGSKKQYRNECSRVKKLGFTHSCIKVCNSAYRELENCDGPCQSKLETYEEELKTCQNKASCTIACKYHISSAKNCAETVSCEEFCEDGGIFTNKKKAEMDQQLERCKKISEYQALYMKQCIAMLNEVNNTKPPHLLCDGSADYNQFCKKKLEDHLELDGEVDDSKLVEQCNPPNTSPENPVCQIINSENYDTLASNEVNNLQNSIITADGQIISNSDCQFEICQKGKNQPCEEDLKLALEEAVEVCSHLQDEAYECCHQPEQCVGGGLATALDGLGKMHVGISGLKGAKKQCDAVKQTSALFGTMQGAMAAQCTRKAEACQQGCAQEKQKIAEQFKLACSHDIRVKASHDENEHTCTKRFFNHYRNQYKSSQNAKEISIPEVPKQCERTGREANRRIQDGTTQLASSLMASMKECGMEPNFEWEPPTPPPRPSAGTPSPPPAPSTPSAPNNPGELTIPGGGGREPTERKRRQIAMPPPGGPENPYDGLGDPPPDEDDTPEEKPGATAGMTGLLGSGGGSSGGGGFGLDGGGGGGYPGGEEDEEDSVKGNKILHGYAGGKFAGYGGGGSASSGGGRGFRGRAKRIKNRRGRAKLDLKKILPKGKQLNNKVGKYGSPHDNIFQRMSNRFQWMCRTDKIPCK